LGWEFFIFLIYFLKKFGGGFIGDYKVTYQHILEAMERIKEGIHHTPLELSQTFSRMSGSEVYLKLENLQKTGAFKVRGAYNKLATLTQQERARGVVTASAGNHAQGVSLVAFKYGIPSTVVMPKDAPEAKVKATVEYGSEVLLHGQNYDEAYEKAVEISKQTGATFIHAFDDPSVIAGQGTIGLEILQDCPGLDVIIVPVGGGGLISGVAIAAKAINPQIKIIGVQPEGANSGYLSWKSKKRQSIQSPLSIADGLSVKQPGVLPFEIMKEVVDDFVTVSDQQIQAAMFLLLERCKLLAEGAGAISLAALLYDDLDLKHKKVALIMSGGNVDFRKIQPILAEIG
jgi:threonine dehydratase